MGKRKKAKRLAASTEGGLTPPHDAVDWFACLKTVTGKKARKKQRVEIVTQTWYSARERAQVLLQCERHEMDVWLADNTDPMC